jgi:Ca2+/H+ antiporter, TMEM165/GDT1 family
MMHFHENRKKNFWMKEAIFAPFVMADGVYIFGSVVMLLWNAILPALFGFHTITFWQALGILLLSKILFGGFGGHCRRGHSGHHMNGRWMHLNEEEREKMRAEWRNRCRTEPKAE